MMSSGLRRVARSCVAQAHHHKPGRANVSAMNRGEGNSKAGASRIKIGTSARAISWMNWWARIVGRKFSRIIAVLIRGLVKRYIVPLVGGVLMLVTLTRPVVAAMLLNLSTLRLVRAGLRSEPAAAYKGDLLFAINLAQGSNMWTASYQASLAEGRGQFWAGDWPAAEMALQAALGRERTPLLAKVFLALVYARTNRPAEARDLWVQLHGAAYFRLLQEYATAA